MYYRVMRKNNEAKDLLAECFEVVKTLEHGPHCRTWTSSRWPRDRDCDCNVPNLIEKIELFLKNERKQ